MNVWQLTPGERESLLAFLRTIIQTPSLPGDEGRVAELIMREMQALGFPEVWMDEAGNVIGSIGDARGPTLLLNAHMDTVEVPDESQWIVNPWSAEVREGRLYGLGACDMKGGIAAAIYGAAHLLRTGTPLKGQLVVANVSLEEPAEGTCTRILFEEDKLAANWVVIVEPSDLQVIRAQRGHVELRLSAKGTSAHSAAPDLGENAIYAASRIVFGLEILAEQLAEDAFLGKGALAVTDIHSRAVSRNAIPERCDLIIDRRLTLGETEALALAEVQRIIAREGVKATVSVIEEDVRTHTGKECRVRRSSPPWALDEHHPLVATMLHAARDVGLRPALGKWDFATEGAYTAGVAQIPTIGFGPGKPAMAHMCNEYVDLQQVYSAAGAYAALAVRLLRG
ncbi:MAG: YgeY family selenium metabolism-linked hydrolase [Anaerolineae bacterium]|nr:YgeY family selenium metabolism-linked hydrolase [Anaerolineae bacterium]